jgi:hypothetical protein
MADLAYREVYAMNRVEARKHLLQTRAVAKSGNRLTDGRGLTKRAQVHLWDREFAAL